MNRRLILSSDAAVATGLVHSVEITVAQSPAEIDGVKAASKAFYLALITGPGEMLSRLH